MQPYTVAAILSSPRRVSCITFLLLLRSGLRCEEEHFTPSRFGSRAVGRPASTLTRIGIGMASVKMRLNRYFTLIEGRVPTKVGTFIRWLRQPSNIWIRFILAGVLTLGGVLSFLPLFGLWMLPLGLLLIAQDIPILQKPLLAALRWIELKWKRLRRRFRTRPS